MLLHRLAGARDSDELVGTERIRSHRTLDLKPPAVAKLEQLAKEKKKLNALWKVISPGKQKAADGTAGSRGQQVQISDALREAAAAAAARATALARGRMQAREAAAAAASGAE